jgi:hypothetical protein
MCTTTNAFLGLELDIGCCTNGYYTFKVNKMGKGRRSVLYVCRAHACGFYSNRCNILDKHRAKLHGGMLRYLIQ